MSRFLKNRFSSYTLADDAIKGGYYSFFRTFQSRQETEVQVKGHKVLMFGSNSYLSLTTHPKVVEAAEEALKKYGTSCSGSRFLNGTTDLHEELEERLANFLHKDRAIVFSTGFQVNLGTIPSVAHKGDAILLDRLNHASIYEGAKLSDASTVIFRHNDMNSLERKLMQLKNVNYRLIVVDGIFSMEGDIAKLPEIIELAERYDASVMCDCAHAVGVLGDHGRGTPDHFGLTDEVELIGGTFSKSFASLGGYIAGDKETITFIKHHARSLIFSASMTPSSTAATLAALDIMESDDSHRQKLWNNTRYALDKLNDLGFDTGDSETPVIPIYIRDNEKAYRMTVRLFEEGIFVNPVVAPAVAPESTLIRFSLMSDHSFKQIDFAIDKITKIAQEIGLELHIKVA
ncbi:MAG: aminotransferase class I/II-fold pyridoxal phosphate-dependent enzyme [Ekhidna sp.]|nr:aminotransferase class I/II-fold pyridoxal phosphate-dependent enzyme [Ekhidna sp.]MBC6425746.1 aminotransferase class I/II-fold pyridoxal phosphate-dependent enzyme [Ekhidna sp.]